jgi:tetratricopeptide (TPR) repeat protein
MMGKSTKNLSLADLKNLPLIEKAGGKMTRCTLISAVIIVLVLMIGITSPGWAQKTKLNLRQLEQAVKSNPNDPRLHYLIGLKYQEEGKNQQALKAYQQAVSLNPRYSEALLRLGELKFAQGDQDGAVKALKKAIQLDPKNQTAKIFLGAVYGKQGLALLGQGKIAEAANVLKMAAANNPQDDAALNNLGVALAAQGDANLAAQAFQEAIRANPSNDSAHFNLGFTYLRGGDKTGALNQYGALTTLGSGYGGELFGLMSYPKGYPMDKPYEAPQWGQTETYKALPAAEFPASPDIADALRNTPDLQIPSYGSSLPRGQETTSDLGRDPGLQTPSYKSVMPGSQLPESRER